MKDFSWMFSQLLFRLRLNRFVDYPQRHSAPCRKDVSFFMLHAGFYLFQGNFSHLLNVLLGHSGKWVSVVMNSKAVIICLDRMPMYCTVSFDKTDCVTTVKTFVFKLVPLFTNTEWIRSLFSILYGLFLIFTFLIQVELLSSLTMY